MEVKFSYLFKQVLASLDPSLRQLIMLVRSGTGIDLVVMLRVRIVEMGALHERRDLLELLVGVSRIVQHDPVENLNQMLVEISRDLSTVFGTLKLAPNLIKRFV